MGYRRTVTLAPVCLGQRGKWRCRASTRDSDSLRPSGTPRCAHGWPVTLNSFLLGPPSVSHTEEDSSRPWVSWKTAQVETGQPWLYRAVGPSLFSKSAMVPPSFTICPHSRDSRHVRVEKPSSRYQIPPYASSPRISSPPAPTEYDPSTCRTTKHSPAAWAPLRKHRRFTRPVTILRRRRRIRLLSPARLHTRASPSPPRSITSQRPAESFAPSYLPRFRGCPVARHFQHCCMCFELSLQRATTRKPKRTYVSSSPESE